MDTGGVESARAGADRQFATLELREEGIPFIVGGGPVFFAGACGPAAGDERPVRFQCLRRIDGLVAHRGRDGRMPYDDLSDVRRKTVHNGVRGKDSPEIMGCEMEMISVCVGGSVGGQGPVENLVDRAGIEGMFLPADGALEQ